MKRKNMWNKAFAAAMVIAMTAAAGGTVYAAEETVITLSDAGVQVDGAEISTDASAAVYAGAEIVYYKAGQDATYGAGSEADGHTQEEAAAHTVITITQPGTYRVTGSISAGQIAVDLGEDAGEDSSAVVNLILDNAEITCELAPGIVVYNAYECGSDDTETATKDVDTSAAGFNLILADDSSNVVTGSHVAKIYKEGTTQEQVDAGEAKKAWKMDGAVQSFVSFNVDGEEAGNGKLHVIADNEGVSGSLHMTVNGGELVINSADDAINTNEDYVSVLTVNGGTITCDSDMGAEGDGIDSNGWIVVNGGYITAGANASSQDSGVDADMGIYINGGTVLAGGNMYDEVSEESAQSFMVFSFAQTLEEGQILLMKDSEGNPVTAFSAVNACQTVVYSCDNVPEGDYTLYKVSSVTGELNGSIYSNITDYTDEVQLQYGSSTAGFGGGRGGMGFGGGQGDQGFGGGQGGQMPEGMENFDPGQMSQGEAPEMPEGMDAGQMPEDMEKPEGMEMPEGMENFDPGQMGQGEAPEMPEGMDAGQMPEGMEKPEDMEMPEGMEQGQAPDGTGEGQMPQGGGRGGRDMMQGGQMAGGQGSITFTISGISNQFAQISEVTESTETSADSANESAEAV